MRDASIRLAVIFKDAGFIDDVTWQKYQKKILSEGKSLGEILTSDALSLKTYRDLLTMEIKLPFGKARRREIQLAMGQPVRISYREMQTILNQHRPEPEELIQIIRSNNLISDEVAEEALDIIHRLGEDSYNALLEREIITPAIISRVVERADNKFARTNRINLSMEILKYNKLLTSSDASEIITQHEKTNTPIAEILIAMKKLQPAELLESILKGLYLPTVNLRETKIEKESISAFPEAFVRRELFLPLGIDDHRIISAMPDPLLMTLADTVSILTGKYVLPYFAPQEEVMNKIIQVLTPERKEPREPEPETPETIVYGKEEHPPVAAPRKVREEKLPGETREREGVVAFGKPRLRRIQTLVDSQSTVQLANSLIEFAIASRTTDIHLEPMRDGLRVRFRIDGKLQNIMRIPREMQLPLISRIKVLSNMDVTERRRPQDGHFGLNVEGKFFDFRISSLPVSHGEKVVLRILEKSTILKGLADLGLNKEHQKIMADLIRKPYGMIMVTGPTGSGKTTTLYSALQLLNSMERNIVTIEDPVEYQLDGINQVQVDYNINLSFANGLRAILRQDPDVIMVGEIRDSETARIAVRAALTGHLVFSTLHANRTVSALNGLIQMGVSPFLTSSAVIAVITQRLVRKICPKCKTSFTPDKGTLDALGLSPDTHHKLYRGKGCDYCLNTGYYGRTGVFEILVMDDEIRNLVVEKTPEHKIFDTVIKKGMTTLMANGVRKVLDGITTPEEVLENIYLT
ncbi:type II/IV secretion system protein [Candidatus Sumerlaeota bacterium]|nr:type II/IV secretion system protein [Candidatus Sumerlaeota bacterium]